jgi:erythromycin esterase
MSRCNPSAVLVLGLAWCLACSKDAAAPSRAVEQTHPVPFLSAYAAETYGFLRRYVGDRSLVQLGESIHVTDELPRARLHLVRYLHEELGFDVIALEGSLVGSWLAQDHLYRSSEQLQAKATRAQELAWFGLWQTEPMRLVMEYVAETQSTRSPLYLASFDIQPGSSRAFGGSEAAALQALFDAMRSYSVLEDEGAAARWREAISPSLGCYRSASPRASNEKIRALTAIGELERWTAAASTKVELATSATHAAALRRIPESLRGSVELCSESIRADSTKGYQEVRDRINATHAVALRDGVSRAHRIILWAHHSHVNHNSTGKNVPSMGQHLLQMAGKDLYTIGLFAGGGRALQVADDAFPPVVPRRIRPASDYGLEGHLGLLRTDDYFIDFSTMRPGNPDCAVWFNELSSRLEIRDMAYFVPAKDYHAAVFVHVVHPAALSMLPRVLALLLTAYGFILDHLIAFVIGAAILVALIIHRWQRRRRLRTPRNRP